MALSFTGLRQDTTGEYCKNVTNRFPHTFLS